MIEGAQARDTRLQTEAEGEELSAEAPEEVAGEEAEITVEA